jgi:hypothetical protein
MEGQKGEGRRGERGGEVIIKKGGMREVGKRRGLMMEGGW